MVQMQEVKLESAAKISDFVVLSLAEAGYRPSPEVFLGLIMILYAQYAGEGLSVGEIMFNFAQLIATVSKSYNADPNVRYEKIPVRQPS
jgi:hypothetical protein